MAPKILARSAGLVTPLTHVNFTAPKALEDHVNPPEPLLPFLHEITLIISRTLRPSG